MSIPLNRRNFLQGTLATLGSGVTVSATQSSKGSLASELRIDWNQGDLAHLLPAVSHDS